MLSRKYHVLNKDSEGEQSPLRYRVRELLQCQITKEERKGLVVLSSLAYLARSEFSLKVVANNGGKKEKDTVCTWSVFGASNVD